MIIEFSDINTKKEKEKKISYEVEAAPFVYDGENIKYSDKIKVEGKVSVQDDVISLKFNVKTKLELMCSRCLDTFIYPIDIDIEERFTNDESKSDDEIVFVKSDSVDITEIIENAMISTLPIKRLCSEKCKGLCQSCGKNLNKETCTCQVEDVDIRLAGLKALIDNKEV